MATRKTPAPAKKAAVKTPAKPAAQDPRKAAPASKPRAALKPEAAAAAQAALSPAAAIPPGLTAADAEALARLPVPGDSNVPAKRETHRDEARAQAKAKGMEMVKASVPQAFTFTDSDHTPISYPAGDYDMPRAHAEDSFSVAMGVTFKSK